MNILHVIWKSLWCVHREFSDESTGERILKIGSHCTRQGAYVFETQCKWRFFWGGLAPIVYSSTGMQYKRDYPFIVKSTIKITTIKITFNAWNWVRKNSRPHSVDQNSGSLRPGSLLTSLRVDCTITTIALDLYSCIEYKTTNITWLLLKLTKCLITTLLYYVLSTATIVCSACCHIFQVAIDH